MCDSFCFFLLVTPIRGTRPSTVSSTTPKISTTESSINAVLLNDQSTVLPGSKSAALVSNDHQQSASFILFRRSKHNLLLLQFDLLDNVGLTLLVVLLSGMLFVILCGFLLYKR